MKHTTRYCLLMSIFLVFACSEKKEELKSTVDETPQLVLPFQAIDLTDLSGFKAADENWKIAGSAYVDRTKEGVLNSTKGTDVLVNNMDETRKGNLHALFEHGDIELEFDVMMPVKSNSGVYFQGRYEIQLLDSWGKDSITSGDMGGIYERWDDTKPEGQKGYEGHAPMRNASKSPGLWQHFKIIFKAPKFDASGKKTQHAEFEQVWLNDALIHKNVRLTGPTRGAVETNEVPKASFMIQGDHGVVAFRNIKYKKYQDIQLGLLGVKMKEYENTSATFPNLDSIPLVRDIATDSISARMATGERPQKLLQYTGKFKVPETGDYIFDYKLNRAGGALIIDADTLINMNGNYNFDSLGYATVYLEKGEIPFELLYNKHVPWHMGFGLYVEGPGVQKHPLHAESSLNLPSEKVDLSYHIGVNTETITQRSFWMHEGEKRTHCIAVGTPQAIHYAYDLGAGALVQLWNGDFIDARKMWEGRGEKQLAEPVGFTLSMHGDPEFAFLKDMDAAWPEAMSEGVYKTLGYEFDDRGVPLFTFQMEDVVITNSVVPSSQNRSVTREIKIVGTKAIWYKIADGESITELPDGTFVVNDESYFIDFETQNLQPQLRTIKGRDELLVQVPSGEQVLNYSIIW